MFVDDTEFYGRIYPAPSHPKENTPVSLFPTYERIHNWCADPTQSLIIRPTDIQKPTLIEYPELRYENEEVIQNFFHGRDKVVTIAASGASSLIALLEGSSQVDAIDINREQIALNFATQFLFLYLVNPGNEQEFHDELARVNRNPTTYNKEVPTERKNVLLHLPNFLSEYQVPEKYWEDISQILLFERFVLKKDLDSLEFRGTKWSSEENIQKIQRAIREHRWTINEADLLEWARTHTGYDAAYTSNVFDHLLNLAKVSQEEMVSAFQHTVNPGGIMNLHNMVRSDDAAWTHKDLEQPLWQNDWMIESHDYPSVMNNGTWHLLTKK